MCPWRAKWDVGSSILGNAPTSCFIVLKYWPWLFRRSTILRLANDRGLALLPRYSLKETVRGNMRAIWEFLEEWWGGVTGGLFIAWVWPCTGLSLGDRRRWGADSGCWLAGAVAGDGIAFSAGAAGGASATLEFAGRERGLAGWRAKPAGRYPRGGRGALGWGTGSGRSGAVNFAGFAWLIWMVPSTSPSS